MMDGKKQPAAQYGEPMPTEGDTRAVLPEEGTEEFDRLLDEIVEKDMAQAAQAVQAREASASRMADTAYASHANVPPFLQRYAGIESQEGDPDTADDAIDEQVACEQDPCGSRESTDGGEPDEDSRCDEPRRISPYRSMEPEDGDYRERLASAMRLIGLLFVLNTFLLLALNTWGGNIGGSMDAYDEASRLYASDAPKSLSIGYLFEDSFDADGNANGAVITYESTRSGDCRLSVGDVIVSASDSRISSADDLARWMESNGTGSGTVGFVRNGVAMTAEVSVSQIGSSAGTLYLYAGEGTGGAIPVTVIAGSAAYSAGMRTGDEITHIEGIPVDSSSYLSVVSLMEGGSEVQVDYTRDGVAGHAMVRCTTDRIRSSDQMEISGIYIDTATDADGKTCGAIVMSIADGSPWYKAGLRAGDVIIGMDGKTVEDVSGLDGVEGAKQISYMCGGHSGIVEVENAKRAAEESKAKIEKRYSEAVEPAKPSLDTRIIAGPVRNPFLDAVRSS